MKRANILALILGLSLATAFQARAENLLTDKDDQVEQMSMDQQVEEVEGYSYDDYATQTNIETSQLNKDISGLKQKISRLKGQRAEAEKRAKRSSESYNLTKKEKFNSEKQAKQFEQLLAKEQREVSALEQRLQKIKDQKAKADDRTKKAKDSLSQVELERRDLLKQQRQLTASLQREMRIKQNLDKRRVGKVAEVYHLRSNVAKLQAQTDRLQNQNHSRGAKTKVTKLSSADSEMSID